MNVDIKNHMEIALHTLISVNTTERENNSS